MVFCLIVYFVTAQPPGVPEICKKSLSMCPTTGNVELFILGKNFLKDTRVIFQQTKHEVNGDRDLLWEETVTPDKEYLQQVSVTVLSHKFYPIYALYIREVPQMSA